MTYFVSGGMKKPQSITVVGHK